MTWGQTVPSHWSSRDYIPACFNRSRTVLSEILRSPGICVAVGVTVVVRFRIWGPRMYRSWATVVTLWRTDLSLSLTHWVVSYRAHRAEVVCLETPKCLATTCWVSPLALLRYLVSVCGLFEGLPMWPYMFHHRSVRHAKFQNFMMHVLLWGLRFCASVQTLTMATPMWMWTCICSDFSSPFAHLLCFIR